MSLDGLNQAMIGLIDRDERSFQAVYEATRRMVYLSCFRICRNPGVAEDLTADVFRLVWQKAHLWQEGLGSVEGWIRTIARNRAIDWQRQQSEIVVRRDAAFNDIPDDGPLVDTVLIQSEEYEIMLDALRRLPPYQRNAIEAAFFGEVTYLVLAQQSGVPLSTMKTWIRRGLAKMRAQLQTSSGQSRENDIP